MNALGMHANSQYQMVRAAWGLQVPAPSVEEGVRVLRVMDAAYRSDYEDRWIENDG